MRCSTAFCATLCDLPRSIAKSHDTRYTRRVPVHGLRGPCDDEGGNYLCGPPVEHARKLHFVLEAVKMFFNSFLLLARPSGECLLKTISTRANGELGDIRGIIAFTERPLMLHFSMWRVL